MNVQNTEGKSMEYNFREIEQKWQQHWEQSGVYKVPNKRDKPKYYVLDMFPYPSGAGLHVGHPLGYIASDIFARYKRTKGFNVLHPMGYDAFGLPAEQYAIEHGVHPAVSTAKNIETFRRQLDKIGFCFDWSREVNTSKPEYYKWTQWIFLQLFDSWYNRKHNKTERIETLIAAFENEGNAAHPIPGPPTPQGGISQHTSLRIPSSFDAEEWKAFDEPTQQAILMEYRIAYCGYGEVNWCEALGTVLANDEVVNGVSERGGYPVEKKRLRQWYLRITEYADRLLQGLQTVDFSDAMKEMQGNWIGKSTGAEINFELAASQDLTPGPSAKERGAQNSDKFGYMTSSVADWRKLIGFAKENRKEPTEAENTLWQALRNRQVAGYKFRRQHPVEGYIPDFVCIEKKLIIEIDGGYHNETEQQQYDAGRAAWLEEFGYQMLRFTNEQITQDLKAILQTIEATLKVSELHSPLLRRGAGGEVLRVYTTRPDTIFGVDFMVVAPEHELVERITTPEQEAAVDEYIAYVKSRSERERMAEKKITGVPTGAYALNPFNGQQIPVWISEYVLAGYGTGAIMAVPCGDERDHKFAQHFGIPITNIIGDAYNGEEANPTKDAVLTNSDFLNGTVMRDAIEIVVQKLEALGIGRRKTNYKMRDAAFSRQRYWGEPFPIQWIDGTAYPLDESELPLELPQVESYKPGPEGEGPLANIPEWIYQKAAPPPPKGGLSGTQPKPTGDAEQNFESSSSGPVQHGQTPPLKGQGEATPLGAGGALETNTMPGYAGSSWYFLRYMDPHNDKAFCDKTISDYWNQVDLYVGGTEHAVGHLLYSRMWTKALYDLGYISFDEPFKKLLNQGMITGISQKIIRADNLKSEKTYSASKQFFTPIDIKGGSYPEGISVEVKLDDFYTVYYSKDVADLFKIGGSKINVDIRFVHENILDIDEYFQNKIENFLDCEVQHEVYVCKDGYYNTKYKKWFYFDGTEISALKFITVSEVEKMSKSKKNVVNPNDIIGKYGADTFRMYEMFLGPVELSKPWETKGIEGVHRFLKKLWRLYVDEQKGLIVTDETPTAAELKVLHRTIKKIEEDIDRFSFNTCVSAFMVCVNDLTDLKCHKRAILEPLLVLLTPFAPHVSEELYQMLQNSLPTGEGRGGASVLDASFPKFEAQHVAESTKEYPISINGRLRTTMTIALDAPQPEVEAMVLQNEVVQKWLEGRPPKKIIFVQGKMVNVVV